jgi:hypothetical protein
VQLNTRLPLFLLARALKKIGKPGDEAIVGYVAASGSCSKEQEEHRACAVQENTPRKRHSVRQEWKGIEYIY